MGIDILDPSRFGYAANRCCGSRSALSPGLLEEREVHGFPQS